MVLSRRTVAGFLISAPITRGALGGIWPIGQIWSMVFGSPDRTVNDSRLAARLPGSSS